MDWILLLLDPCNIFPLDEEDKFEIFMFNVVAFEQVWLYRNKKLRGEDIPDIVIICTNVSILTNKYKLVAKSKNRPHKQQARIIKWNPPPKGFLKINFDASVREDDATTGIIVRDSDGNVIGAWTCYSIVSSLYDAEA